MAKSRQRIPFDLELYRSRMQPLLEEEAAAAVFWDALDFAADAHEDQWRRSGEAYIMHPCSVALIMADELDVIDPEILAAALLHDTVEDVEEVTIELVGAKFGSYVAAIVEGCTKVTQSSAQDKQTHSKMVHRKIFSGAASRPEVMLVKLADRLHNLRTLSAMPRHKRQKIADETLDIYAPLATVLGLFNLKREMYDLALSYKFPKQSTKLRGQIRQLSKSTTAVEIVEVLNEKTAEVWLSCTISIRTKGLWAYYDANNRILRKKIDNPLEILLLVDDSQACYRALGIVNQIFPPIPRTIRDFIANPKPTGYQGLHARAIVKGERFLFKIRTKNMARRAQRGLFKNWSSKNHKQGKFIREIQELFGVIGYDDSVSYRDVIADSGRKEIYTYTPQGDLICLPVNSTVLDFAFRVHTEIGHSCIGAMIGIKKEPPEYSLKDGDVIRILRADHPVHFEQKMLGLCKTARARAELSKAFRARWDSVAGEVGFSILRQEMRRYGLPFELFYKKDTGQLLNHFSLEELDELYVRVGKGKIRLPELIEQVKVDLYSGQSPLAEPTGAFNKIELTTLDPVSIKMSNCCKPTPTDPRLCALLSERNLSVHSLSCPQLEKLKFQREDIVELRWKRRETLVLKEQALVVMAATRHRMMMLAGVAPEEMKILDLMALSKAPTPTPAWELTFTVPNLHALRKVLKHFEKSGIVYEFALES
ncbi:MAG: HD domain-containing protein [Thermodesulfobacteriota bacterium]